jgi:hypothetical protein
MVAVGGGYTMSRDDVGAQTSFPFDADTWRVTAVELDGTNQSWTVTTYVLCIPEAA